MKTYLDFNMEAIKKTIAKSMKEEGKELSGKQVAQLLASMMKQKDDVPPIKVACLTCGRPYPLNSLEHECQKEDIWLNHYVTCSQGNKDIPWGCKGALQKKYPLKHRNSMIFRGINFDTKEQYEEFMFKIKDGQYTFSEISSWTLDYKKAVSFARFIMKGTRGNEEIRRNALMEMAEKKANITGYKGIVLGMNVYRKMVLCDISHEGIANRDEEEIILLQGTYPVTIMQVIEKKEGTYAWDINIENMEEILQK